MHAVEFGDEVPSRQVSLVRASATRMRSSARSDWTWARMRSSRFLDGELDAGASSRSRRQPRSTVMAAAAGCGQVLGGQRLGSERVQQPLAVVVGFLCDSGAPVDAEQPRRRARVESPQARLCPPGSRRARRGGGRSSCRSPLIRPCRLLDQALGALRCRGRAVSGLVGHL